MVCFCGVFSVFRFMEFDNSPPLLPAKREERIGSVQTRHGSTYQGRVRMRCKARFVPFAVFSIAGKL